MSTSSRVFLGSVLLLSFVLALFYMMSYLKFQGMLTGLVQRRLEVIASDIATALEGAVTVGIPLQRVRTGDALLERAKESDKELQVLDVFDHRGVRLFSTSLAGVGKARVTEEVLQAHRAASGRTWALETTNAFLAGARLVNSSGKQIGGVAVSLSRETFEERLSSFATGLAQQTIFVFLGVAVVLLLGVQLGLRELRKVLAAMRGALDRLEEQTEAAELGPRGAAAGADKSSPQNVSIDDMDACVDAIAAHYANASADVGQFERGQSALAGRRAQKKGVKPGSAGQSFAEMRERTGAKNIAEMRSAIDGWVKEETEHDDRRE